VKRKLAWGNTSKKVLLLHNYKVAQIGLMSANGSIGTMSIRSVALQAALLTVFLPLTHAWDKDGHEAIGMTTMSALQTGPVAQVKRLMHGKDAVDVAAWAHKVNKKYPWTSELHFQKNQKCGETNFTDCPGNRCLVKALKHFYGRLVNKQLVNIEWPGGIKLTDADAVKFLINLIGDLHQPMHFGVQGDDLGLKINVTFRGKKVSLYDMWDREITQAVIKDSPGFWWGGWTHVQRTRIEYDQDGEKWKKEGINMFDKWANESVKFLCNTVYGNLLAKTGQDVLPETMSSGNFHVDEVLFESWKRELLSRLLVAGARTAIVLNSILQQREAINLQGGTAVSELEGEDDNERRGPPPVGRKAEIPHGVKVVHGPQALATNSGICVVVVILFLLLVRSLNVDPVGTRVKMQEGGKKL